jgi:hypothetical protein
MALPAGQAPGSPTAEIFNVHSESPEARLLSNIVETVEQTLDRLEACLFLEN